MAIVSMADAVEDEVASSGEYNKLIDNIEDLDSRLSALDSSTDGRLDFIEDGASLEVHLTAQQDLVPSTPTLISWDNSVDDSLGFYSAGSPTLLTCQQDGKYNVNVHVVFEVGGTGVRWVFCTLNSTDTTNDTFLFAGGSADGVIAIGGTDVRLADGDVIRVYAYHDNTENRTLDTTFGGTKITFRRVGP